MPRKKKNLIKKALKKVFNKRTVGIAIAVSLVTSLVSAIIMYRDVIFNSYPAIVSQYRMRYNEMNTSEYLEQLRAYARDVLNDSFDGLDYAQLVLWEHKHLGYWGGALQVRPEMPIEILSTNLFGTIQMKNGMPRYAIYCSKTQTFTVYLLEGETTADIQPNSWNWEGWTVGRCGEFALLYNGLLLANGYRSRIVVDASHKTDDRVAGDHVWNEVYIEETNMWLHVDPTERVFNSPDMYSNPDKWNKNVNTVFGIEGSEIVDLTEKYR